MATSAVMGWIPYMSGQCQWHVGSYCYIPSGLLLKTDTTQNPLRGNIYPYRGALRHAKARVPFLGSWVRRASGGIPSAHAQL
jgi:hypothetical protein